MNDFLPRPNGDDPFQGCGILLLAGAFCVGAVLWVLLA